LGNVQVIAAISKRVFRDVPLDIFDPRPLRMRRAAAAPAP
jgi:hypothetical protein